MRGFTAGEAARRMADVIGRDVDAVIVNDGRPPDDVIESYAAEHKELLPIGDVPPGCEVVVGDFWSSGIARHDRRRLAYAVWSVLAGRLLD